jgi:AMP phosphorylase
LPERSLALEDKAIRLASKLLRICLLDTPSRKDENPVELAKEILTSGKALAKMREIIKIQGGNPHVVVSDLKPGPEQYRVRSARSGRIVAIDNQQISAVCRILGCPTDKKAGMYLNRKIEESVDKGDILCTLYSTDKWRLKEAIITLTHIPIYTVK